MADAIYVPKSDILDLITEENEAGGFTDYSNYSNLWDEVDDMPAADVKPVKHGRWIAEYDCGYITPHCSECGETALTKEETGYDYVYSSYCPHCGAKMDGGEK